LDIKKSDVVNVIHDLIKLEYKKYRKNKNIDKVLLDRDEITNILNKYGNVEVLLNKLLEEGLIVKYIVDGRETYRSIYFDTIQDYVGIKETKLGKPTVFEYKVLEPHMEHLPLINISCNEIYNEVLETILHNLPKDLDNKIYQAIQRIVYGIVCLRRKYSNMQRKSILTLLDKMFKRAGEGIVISAPTGWGKTEAFMIPILIYTIVERILGVKGVKAILIYPRKALASNQVKRLIEYYIKLYRWFRHNIKDSSINIDDLLPLIAIRDGQSKSPSEYSRDSEFRVHTVKVLVENEEYIRYKILVNDYYSIKVEAIEPINVLESYVFPITNVYFELLGGDKVPDIIVTNLDTFNRMLATPRFSVIWKRPDSIACIVYDEAHVYDKSNLIHLVYIIRRTRTLLKELERKLLKRDVISQPLMVFSSATLHEEFKEILEKALDTKIHRITHEDSKDPDRVKLELVTIIAPRPNVAGQWIAQLIGLYNIVHSISKAIKTKAIIENKSIPYKAILFVDSLHYLRSIKRFISDILLQRLDKILIEHYSDKLVDPFDRDHWSFIDNELILYIENNLNLIKDKLVKAHWADLPQNIREQIEEEFNEKTYPSLLVSTSTLELGIDIPDLWSIIQFRPPIRSDSFIQRIGRAGRSDKTLRVALGTLILTNQPSDISYLVDDRKSKELFKILPPKMPKNMTIIKQHLFLAIADFLNIKGLLNMIDDRDKDIVNLIFYGLGNEKIDKKHAKKYADMINAFKSEIIDYIKQIVIDVEDKNKFINDTINQILDDLRKIYNPSDIKEKLVRSESINKIVSEIKDLIKQTHEISTRIQDIIDEIEENSFITRHGSSNVSDCVQMRLLKKAISQGKIADLQRIYDEYLDILGERIDRIEEVVEELENVGCKKVLDEIYSELINLKNKLKELMFMIKRNVDLKDYIESESRLSEFLSISDTLSSLLSVLTQNGMYYTGLMTQPLKHVEITYRSGRPRHESLLTAFSRIASLSVDKPVERGEEEVE